MHSKAIEATKHLDFDPGRIAKRMTMPVVGRTLIFADEVVQNAFFDFWSYEYRVNGKTLVETVDPAAAGFSALEIEVLEAVRHARTSLFQIEEVAATKPELRLADLLEPGGAGVWITDQGLSSSMRTHSVRLALFCRLVKVEGISMTSGFNFGFEPERVPGILQALRQKTKKTPPDMLSETRFVFFFQKYRQFGVEQHFEDVI